MKWRVEIGDEFEPEFDELSEDVQDEMLANARLIEEYGPQLGRPRVDTLNGSRHTNMKELRFKADDGVWLAWHSHSTASVTQYCLSLAINQAAARALLQLIRKADERFDAHLARLKAKERR